MRRGGKKLVGAGARLSPHRRLRRALALRCYVLLSLCCPPSPPPVLAHLPPSFLLGSPSSCSASSSSRNCSPLIRAVAGLLQLPLYFFPSLFILYAALYRCCGRGRSIKIHSQFGARERGCSTLKGRLKAGETTTFKNPCATVNGGNQEIVERSSTAISPEGSSPA